MTALTLATISTLDTTLTAACKLLATTGTNTYNSPTQYVTSLGWGEIFLNGSTTWTGGGSSMGAPTGHGAIWNVTTLEGQTIAAGQWTLHYRAYCTNTGALIGTGTFFWRLYKYTITSGLYTQLDGGTTTTSPLTDPGRAITTTASNYTVTGTLPAMSFGVGDRLYLDVWLHLTAGASSNGRLRYQASSGTTSGSVNIALVTPGYAPSIIPLSSHRNTTGRSRINLPATGGTHTSGARGRAQVQAAASGMSAPPGYALLPFHDTFPGPTLDSTKWIPQIADQYGIWQDNGLLPMPYSAIGNHGNYNAEYGDPAQIIFTPGGGITLNAVKSTTFPNYTWKAGYITTHGKFTFSRGYVQIRAKMPESSTGGWGGIWFLEGGTEIDLVESGTLGGSGNVNWNIASNLHTTGNSQYIVNVGVDLSADFHIYGMEYKPGQSVTIYFDGTPITTWTMNIPTGSFTIILTMSMAQNTTTWHTAVSGATPSPVLPAYQISEVQVWLPGTTSTRQVTGYVGIRPAGPTGRKQACGRVLLQSAWPSLYGGYQYRKLISIAHTKVSSNLTNFPVFLSLIGDPTLKDVAHGGHVQNNTFGYDIIVVDTFGTTQLDHEVERYDGTTGTLLLWVRLPTLSSTTDTSFYCYYGNSAITTSQEHRSSVWETNYRGVWHLAENPAGVAPQMKDSTTNSNHLTSGGTWIVGQQIAGQLDGSLVANGTDDTLRKSDALSLKPETDMTLSLWMKGSQLPSVATHDLLLIYKDHSAAPWFSYLLSWQAVDNTLSVVWVNTGSTQYTTTSTTALSTNSWYYVTYTKAGSVGKLYLNGRDTTATSGTLSGTLFNSNSDFYLGGISGKLYPGQLDEVRISALARSADWIATEYANQSDPSSFFSRIEPEQSSLSMMTRPAQGRAQVVLKKGRNAIGRLSTLGSFPRRFMGRIRYRVVQIRRVMGRITFFVPILLTSQARLIMRASRKLLLPGTFRMKIATALESMGRFSMILSQQLLSQGRIQYNVPRFTYGMARIRTRVQKTISSAARLPVAVRAYPLLRGRSFFSVQQIRRTAARFREKVRDTSSGTGFFLSQVHRWPRIQGRSTIAANNQNPTAGRLRMRVRLLQQLTAQWKLSSFHLFLRIQGRTALQVVPNRDVLTYLLLHIQGTHAPLENGLGRFLYSVARTSATEAVMKIGTSKASLLSIQAQFLLQEGRITRGRGRMQLAIGQIRSSIASLFLSAPILLVGQGRLTLETLKMMRGKGRWKLSIIPSLLPRGAGSLSASIPQTSSGEGRWQSDAVQQRRLRGGIRLHVTRILPSSIGRVLLYVAQQRRGRGIFPLSRMQQQRFGARLYGAIPRTQTGQGQYNENASVSSPGRGYTFITASWMQYALGRIAIAQAEVIACWNGLTAISAPTARTGKGHWSLRSLIRGYLSARFRIHVAARQGSGGTFLLTTEMLDHVPTMIVEVREGTLILEV